MEVELTLWRVKRLQDAIDALDGGNLNAFGRRMGWADGSYVGQILRGTRPITEKFILRLESIPKMAGWFDQDTFENESDSIERKIRTELLQRDIPEHVLQTILDLVTHCPMKRRVA
jgi:hypothetical protein